MPRAAGPVRRWSGSLSAACSPVPQPWRTVTRGRKLLVLASTTRSGSTLRAAHASFGPFLVHRPRELPRAQQAAKPPRASYRLARTMRRGPRLGARHGDMRPGLVEEDQALEVTALDSVLSLAVAGAPRSTLGRLRRAGRSPWTSIQARKCPRRARTHAVAAPLVQTNIGTD